MFAFCKRQHCFASKRCVQGFSLIELMAVVSISAILFSLAVPGISSWVDRSRAKAARQQLYVAVVEARSIALKQSQTVTVCHLQGEKCQTEFALPISLFTDHNRNSILDSGEEILRVVNLTLPEKIELSWNRKSFMRFWPSGGTGALTGSLSYCDTTKPDYDFRLVIARTGRARIDTSETRCDVK